MSRRNRNDSPNTGSSIDDPEDSDHESNEENVPLRILKNKRRDVKKKKAKTPVSRSILSVMMGKNARIFTVTKLFNLDLSEAGLKRYRKILRERVKGVLLSKSDKKFRVEASFKEHDDLVLTEFDHVALSVEVAATPLNEDDDDEIESAPQVLYSALFICTGLTREVTGAAQLPFLVIYKSKKNIEPTINTALESLFDCMIRPLQLSSEDVKHIFCSTLPISTESRTTLGFDSADFEKNDMVELALESQNMDAVRKLLAKKDDFDARTVTFFKKIEGFVQKEFEANISSFRLCKFMLSELVLFNDGRFLASSEKVLASFLKTTTLRLLQREADELSFYGFNLPPQEN